MTEITPQTQQAIDAHFVNVVKQTLDSNRKTVFSREMQIIVATPDAALHGLTAFQRTVSPHVIKAHRNELARSFIHVLRNQQWDAQRSEQAVPLVDYFLDLRQGRSSGAYLELCKAMVEWANLKLTTTEEQKQTWKQRLKPRSIGMFRDVGYDSIDAVPPPIFSHLSFMND